MPAGVLVAGGRAPPRYAPAHARVAAAVAAARGPRGALRRPRQTGTRVPLAVRAAPAARASAAALRARAVGGAAAAQVDLALVARPAAAANARAALAPAVEQAARLGSHAGSWPRAYTLGLIAYGEEREPPARTRGVAAHDAQGCSP